MKMFIRELLKQFHPDNKETGDNEKFIKVKDKIDKKDPLIFYITLSVKDLVKGKAINLGNEKFDLNDKCNPRLMISKFQANDGTEFFVKYSYEKNDLQEGLEIKDNMFIKTIELNIFDALFGGKRVNFSIYDEKKEFYIRPFMNIKTDKLYETDYKIRTYPLMLKFIIRISDKDEEFIKKLRKIYEEE